MNVNASASNQASDRQTESSTNLGAAAARIIVVCVRTGECKTAMSFPLETMVAVPLIGLLLVASGLSLLWKAI